MERATEARENDHEQRLNPGFGLKTPILRVQVLKHDVIWAQMGSYKGMVGPNYTPQGYSAIYAIV